MAAGQQWFFPPARPLVERLGQPFFRAIPTQPGVYVMRNAHGEVVYVGKARNLRLFGAVLRLLWLALHHGAGFSRLPCGWAHDCFDLPVTMPCGGREPDLRQALEEMLRGSTEPSGTRWRALLPGNLAAFDQAALAADLEELESFTARVDARLHPP